MASFDYVTVSHISAVQIKLFQVNCENKDFSQKQFKTINHTGHKINSFM